MKSEVLGLISDLMSKIDNIPCNPKNKLQLYHRFALSKILWHFTIADLGKIWVVDNIDNIASKFICQWLKLPISATLALEIQDIFGNFKILYQLWWHHGIWMYIFVGKILNCAPHWVPTHDGPAVGGGAVTHWRPASYAYDGRYTWHHESVLYYLAKSLSLVNASLYADLPSSPSPSLVIGDSFRPDLVLVLNNTTMYLLELTVSFESNIKVNSDYL